MCLRAISLLNNNPTLATLIKTAWLCHCSYIYQPTLPLTVLKLSYLMSAVTLSAPPSMFIMHSVSCFDAF